MHLIGSILFLLLGSCRAFEIDIEQYFKEYMIVPTFLKSAPESVLSVRYGNQKVNLGSDLSGFAVTYPPYISYEAEQNELYALVFVDLDQPSGFVPFESPYLHLLVVNIPGANVTDGDFLTSYLPPLPYPGSGYHRYLFLVYKQTSSICTTTLEFQRWRGVPSNFLLQEFSAQNDLGDPVFGNFFISSLVACGYRRNDTISRTCS